jgi:hypothetical protein
MPFAAYSAPTLLPGPVASPAQAQAHSLISSPPHTPGNMYVRLYPTGPSIKTTRSLPIRYDITSSRSIFSSDSAWSRTCPSAL